MRKVVDCRDYPGEHNCTLTIAGEESELMKAAVEHAISTHGEKDGAQLREGIRGLMKDEMPTGMRPAQTRPGVPATH